MKYFQKITTCALAATMLLGMGTMMTGCGKKASTAVIEASDSWYNTKRIELDAGYDVSEFTYIQHNTPLLVKDSFVVLYLAQKSATFEEMRDPNFDYNSILVSDLVLFDKDGSKTNTINLNDEIATEGSVAQVTAISPAGDGVGIFYITQDVKALVADYKNYYAKIDLSTGKMVGDPVELNFGKQDVIGDVKNIDGYDILSVITASDDDYSFHLNIYKEGNKVSDIDFDKDLGKGKMQYFDKIFSVGEGKLRVIGYGNDENITADIDIESGRATVVEDSKYDLNSNLSSFDGKTYDLSDDGLKLVEEDKETDFILFDDCNVNRCEVSSGKILNVSDGSATIICDGYTENALEGAPLIVYSFEKAEKNPNAGKKIITVANLAGELDYSEGEGIRVFNETNKDYFAKIVTYDVDDYGIDNNSSNNDDKSASNDKAAASMANALAVDLMNGTGPDVILGAADFGELLNEEYLEDLTTYVGGDNGLDTSKYYSNIIDASKTGDKLFFMPYSYEVVGILCDGTSIKDGQIGFTYDEYNDFVNTVCNGEEPYTKYGSRMDFFKECIANSSETWVKDGKVNFDSDEFRALAKYFKENVGEGVTETDDEASIFDSIYSDSAEGAQVIFLNPRRSMVDMCKYGTGSAFLGFPSMDGRGPSISIYSSGSVSAKSDNKDGAWDFLKTLASEDIQKYSDSNVLNIAAEEKILEDVEKLNSDIYTLYTESYGMQISDKDLAQYGLYKKDAGFVDMYKEFLKEASGISSSNKAITNIVCDEIQSYFADQKDIDTVIGTIQDRTQTVLDESK